MSKERLEVIKEVYDIQAMQTFSDRETVPFNLNDIRWLVEQSERVQELEEELEKGETLLEKILPIYKRLKKQNKRYREALEYIGNHVNDSEWMSNVVDTKLIKAIIREALEELK